MTILYKSVLIETVEQAEALPIGTLVIHYPRHGMEDQSGIRVRGGWQFTGTNPDTFFSADVIGMEALVPIEAEEQYVAPDAITYTRYVTAWEEA